MIVQLPQQILRSISHVAHREYWQKKPCAWARNPLSNVAQEAGKLSSRERCMARTSWLLMRAWGRARPLAALYESTLRMVP